MALVPHYIYTCDGGARGSSGVLGVSGQVPTCNPGSGGQWVQVYVKNTNDEGVHDPTAIGEAFGYGFVFASAPLLTVMLVRLVLRSFFAADK